MRSFCTFIAASAIAVPAAYAPAAAQESPVAVVQSHIDAYRARNLNAFMRSFASDAVVVIDGVAVQGHAQIRELYSLNFAPGAPKLKMISSGQADGVVWFESGYVFQDGSELCCGYSEYTVENGKITMLVARTA
ncbi:nuclear transport factor 2 family protein [Pontixanthobacter luteolus]|uniref:nuclear transport factor 2 family protein n=1 Tax=Pontixanthobacter luteolus TaxID=295089 RepID=UPI002303A62D|nr:nuclear transport factor 2 family protein [Pontixanthobacter luteolus]